MNKIVRIIFIFIFIFLANCKDEAKIRACENKCHSNAKVCLLALSDQGLLLQETFACTLYTGSCLSACDPSPSSSSSGGSRHSSGGSGHSSGSGSGSGGHSGGGGHGGGGH